MSTRVSSSLPFLPSLASSFPSHAQQTRKKKPFIEGPKVLSDCVTIKQLRPQAPPPFIKSFCRDPSSLIKERFKSKSQTEQADFLSQHISGCYEPIGNLITFYFFGSEHPPKQLSRRQYSDIERKAKFLLECILEQSSISNYPNEFNYDSEKTLELLWASHWISNYMIQTSHPIFVNTEIGKTCLSLTRAQPSFQQCITKTCLDPLHHYLFFHYLGVVRATSLQDEFKFVVRFAMRLPSKTRHPIKTWLKDWEIQIKQRKFPAYKPSLTAALDHFFDCSLTRVAFLFSKNVKRCIHYVHGYDDISLRLRTEVLGSIEEKNSALTTPDLEVYHMIFFSKVDQLFIDIDHFLMATSHLKIPLKKVIQHKDSVLRAIQEIKHYAQRYEFGDFVRLIETEIEPVIEDAMMYLTQAPQPGGFNKAMTIAISRPPLKVSPSPLGPMTQLDECMPRNITAARTYLRKRRCETSLVKHVHCHRVRGQFKHLRACFKLVSKKLMVFIQRNYSQEQLRGFPFQSYGLHNL